MAAARREAAPGRPPPAVSVTGASLPCSPSKSRKCTVQLGTRLWQAERLTLAVVEARWSRAACTKGLSSPGPMCSRMVWLLPTSVSPAQEGEDGEKRGWVRKSARAGGLCTGRARTQEGNDQRGLLRATLAAQAVPVGVVYGQQARVGDERHHLVPVLLLQRRQGQGARAPLRGHVRLWLGEQGHQVLARHHQARLARGRSGVGVPRREHGSKAGAGAQRGSKRQRWAGKALRDKQLFNLRRQRKRFLGWASQVQHPLRHCHVFSGSLQGWPGSAD